MVKINEIGKPTDNKLLLQIFLVLALAVICTVLLSFYQAEKEKTFLTSGIDLPVIYETASIKIETADHKNLGLELYIEPYAKQDLSAIYRSESAFRSQIQKKLGTYSYSDLISLKDRALLKALIKRQIDLTLYPSTVKNIHFDLVRI